MLRLLLLCLLCSPLVVADEIYKTVDKDGKIIYTDNPVGTKIDAVDLPPINTQPPQASKQRPSKKVEYPPPTHYDVQVTSPADQTQVLPGQRDILVTASLNPPLFPGHKIQILVNGKPFGAAAADNSVLLKEIYRGTHQIQASAINKKGKTIGTSKSITIYVRRASISK